MVEAVRIEFPDELLATEDGWLSGFVRSGRGFRINPRGEYTAIVPLRPFALPEGHRLAGEREQTSLQFDSLQLPVSRVGELAGTAFEAEGDDALAYGELRIAGSDVPLELRRIAFDEVRNAGVAAILHVRIGFEDELGSALSGFAARDAVLHARLEFDTEPALLPAFALLGGAFRPSTRSMLFFEVPAADLAAWFAEWIGGHEPRRPVTSVRLRGTLPEALQRIAPLTAGAIRRRLILPTRSAWSAFVDNSILGTDASHVGLVAEALRCRALRMVCGADAVMFALYGPDEVEHPYGRTNCLRHVYVTNEGSWQFAANGHVQPFERLERYAERRVRDRFTPQMLRAYLAALGIHAFEERFYLPDGQAWLVEKDVPLYPDERAWSFAEVQAGLPWAPPPPP